MDQYTVPLAIDGTKFFDALDKADKELTDLSGNAQNAGKAISATMTTVGKAADDATEKMGAGAAGAKVLSDALNDTNVKSVSLRAQLRGMKNELAELEQAGKTGTARFQELSKKAGETALQIQVTQKRVKDLATETKGLDAAVSAVRGLAGAFAVTEGITAAFGSENEELAQSLKKVEGAMAILIGVQEVAEVLKKDSALRVVLESLAYKENTAAIVAETAALGTEAAATESATVATDGFTAALLINPIFLIVAAIVAAGVALYEFSRIGHIAKDSTKELNNALETNAKLLELDKDSLKKRTDLAIAQAQLTDAKQSEITAITGKALEAQLKLEQDNVEETRKLYNDAQNDNEIKVADYKKAADAYNKALQDQSNTEAEIEVKSLEFKKQKIDEDNAEQKNRLSAIKENFTNEKTLLDQADQYRQQIVNSQIAQLKDGQDKELQALNNGVKNQIAALNKLNENDAKQLEFRKKEIALDKQSTDEVIAIKMAGYKKDLELTQQQYIIRAQLIKQLEDQRVTDQQKIIEKYNQDLANLELDAALQLNDLRKQSYDVQVNQLNLNYEKELNDIKEHYKGRNDLIEGLEDAAAKKHAQDLKDLALENTLKTIETDKTNNTAKITVDKAYATDSIQVQKEKNVALTNNELIAAELSLQALRDAGKKEEDAAVLQARAVVQKAKDARDQAIKDAKPNNWIDLLFPEATDDQKNAIKKIAGDGIKEVENAVTSITNLIIAKDQAQIDAQKKKVAADDDALSTLKDQLTTEQDLKNKGYASNIAGIQAEIAAKTQQRNIDAAKQEEYQKKMEKAQKAQIIAQTALEASNLILAATNIYLALSETVVGEIGATVIVAAMIAAFVAAKVQAFQAVGQTTAMADGGWIDGKSHAEGGQKYIAADGSGRVTELEAGEHVTNKQSAKKYGKLLDAINHNKIMGDSDLHDLLEGTGVHFADNKEEGVEQARVHISNNVMMAPAQQKTPHELRSMDASLKKMLANEANRETVYQENGYLVKKKGNVIIRTPIKK